MDLLAIAIITAAVAPLVGFSAGPVRIAVGLLLVLFSPGYTLLALLLPRKSDLNIVERLGLSVGLSVAIVPLVGLVLNYTPAGIDGLWVVISIMGLVLLGCVAAAFRRSRLSMEDRFEPRLRVRIPRWRRGTMGDHFLLAGLVLSVVFAAGMSAYVIATPRPVEAFTEFYVLGPEGAADGYPSELTLGESGEVILGIVNREGEDSSYAVQVTIDGQATSVALNGQDTEQVGPVSLCYLLLVGYKHRVGAHHAPFGQYRATGP